jgi:hypothetical protein
MEYELLHALLRRGGRVLTVRKTGYRLAVGN